MKNSLYKKAVVVGMIVLFIGASVVSSNTTFRTDENTQRLVNQNVVVTSNDWWNTSWSYRKQITINHTKVDDDFVNFPVLICLTDDDLAGKAQNNGSDVVFTDYSGNKLNHEIELYNSTSGELIAWVNITNLSSSSDTILYLYYGNPSVSNQENIVGTWNDGYVGVLHLNENGTGTRYDSTSHNNDGSTGGYEGDEATENGRIGGADDFDGVDDNIEIADGASLDITGDITISAWVKLKATSGDRFKIVDKVYWGNSTDNSGYYLTVWDGNFDTTVLNNHSENINAFAVSNEVWYYVVGTWNGTHLKLYVDGSMQGTPVSTSISTIGTNNENVYIASNTRNKWYWNGTIDEVRISDVSRSGDWINTTYNTMNSPSTFYSVGGEETEPTPPKIPILDLQNIKGGLLGISVALVNSGEATAYDIKWEMNLSEIFGFLFFPKHANGEITQLEPGEEAIIDIGLMFGLGESTVTFYCEYTMILNDSRSELDIGVKQEWRDNGYLIFHTFPEGKQPTKEWRTLKEHEYEYTYFNDVKIVNFTLGPPEPLQLHNVRVHVKYSPDIMFLGACKLIAGEGQLKENWITKNMVESGDAYWQVELVNGE